MPELPSLKRIRNLRAMSQRDLAERSGVAKSTIVQLEKRKAEARPTTVRKLASALECSAADLQLRAL